MDMYVHIPTCTCTYVLPPHLHTPVHVHTPYIFVSNNNPYTIVSEQLFGTLPCQFPWHALGRRIVCGNIAREAVHGEGQTTFTFITAAPLLLPEVLVDTFPRYQMPRSCFVRHLVYFFACLSGRKDRWYLFFPKERKLKFKEVERPAIGPMAVK